MQELRARSVYGVRDSGHPFFQYRGFHLVLTRPNNPMITGSDQPQLQIDSGLDAPLVVHLTELQEPATQPEVDLLTGRQHANLRKHAQSV